MKKADVYGLYWAAAGGLSAYSLNPMDMELGVRVPEFLALVNRAYELDPGFSNGSLDDFYVIFYAAFPEHMGEDKTKIETHYRRAVEKSGGLSASPYVSYAEAVSIHKQDYDTFKLCLETALAIDPDADPSNRLVNVISHRKARYLLDNAALYFIDLDNDWDSYE
jgi:predicted anti-sigma-YlaC factor YlaD